MLDRAGEREQRAAERYALAQQRTLGQNGTSTQVHAEPLHFFAESLCAALLCGVRRAAERGGAAAALRHETGGSERRRCGFEFSVLSLRCAAGGGERQPDPNCSTLLAGGLFPLFAIKCFNVVVPEGGHTSDASPS